MDCIMRKKQIIAIAMQWVITINQNIKLINQTHSASSQIGLIKIDLLIKVYLYPKFCSKNSWLKLVGIKEQIAVCRIISIIIIRRWWYRI